MNVITWFKDYLQQVEDAVPGINRNRMVIDNSQLTNYLSEHQSDHNMLLVGVLPDLSSKGQTADDYQKVLTTQFMILEKTTYSEVNYEEFFDIFERAYGLAELVIKKMLTESLSGCSPLRKLNIASIQVIPVWNRSSCNGCSVLFSLDMSI